LLLLLSAGEYDRFANGIADVPHRLLSIGILGTRNGIEQTVLFPVSPQLSQIDSPKPQSVSND
jgi:hypothetical protein